MKRAATLAALLVLATILSACTVVLPVAERVLTPQPSATAPATVSATMTAPLAVSATRAAPDVAALDLPNAQLEALGAAILEQDLLADVAGEEPLTLLAPSDAAFGALDSAYVSGLLADRAQLEAFVRRHVIPGRLSLADLSDGAIETLSGESLSVAVEPDGVTIEGARVLQGDIAVPFGLVHVIDRILPETTVEAVHTPTAEPTRTATPRPTLIVTPTAAPTMTSEPSATATSTPSPTPTPEPTRTATLAPTQTAAPLPTMTATPQPAATATVARAETLDIMGRVAGTPGLSKLAELLRLAGMDTLLGGKTDLTLLAPTDDAFSELSEAELSGLTADKDALRAWLERYILPSRLSAAELQRMTAVKALSGDVLAIRSRSGLLIIGGTRVLERDIPATNGLIHTVDTVVLP
jgi:uncharacterized surface protein with fasciclin (FAS1) repeats